MKKITINDVAKVAKVSKKTVSRVLNNEPNVSDKTRKIVTDIAQKLGYRPNPYARGLASNHSFILALIYDNPNTNYINSIQTGALEVCQKHSYHLLIHPCEAREQTMISQIDELITHSRVDGLVLTPPFSDLHILIEFLRTKNIPFVRIGSTEDFSCSPSVISNDELASYEMTQYLISLGHVHFGFIKGHPQHNSAALRFSGFKKAINEAHLKVTQQWIDTGDYTFNSGERCARKILSQIQKPTAIFCCNDYMAAGVLKVAKQMEISVPHQLSVTGFDDAPISSYIWPSITTIRQPVAEMAQRAAQLLLSHMKHNETENQTITLNSTGIHRESSAPPFKRS